MRLFRRSAPTVTEDPMVAKALRRLARKTHTEVREYSISLWAYGMRIAENPSEHLEDDLGEMDMTLAALRAVRERLAAG